MTPSDTPAPPAQAPLTCRACHAPIRFASLRTGKRVVVEPDRALILPDPATPASERVTVVARGQILVGRLVPPRTPFAVEGPLLHRSRCAGASGAPAPVHPPSEGSSRCRSCHAPIRWRVTSAGKRLPVDLGTLHISPSPEGSTVLVTEDGEVVRGHRLEHPTPGAVAGSLAHFATCPQASQHRQR